MNFPEDNDCQKKERTAQMSFGPTTGYSFGKSLSMYLR